ncbi:MAG: hypothetical protein P8Y12_10810 [Gammaproteobacteria bacterium]
MNTAALISKPPISVISVSRIAAIKWGPSMQVMTRNFLPRVGQREIHARSGD